MAAIGPRDHWFTVGQCGEPVGVPAARPVPVVTRQGTRLTFRPSHQTNSPSDWIPVYDQGTTVAWIRGECNCEEILCPRNSGKSDQYILNHQ